MSSAHRSEAHGSSSGPRPSKEGFTTRLRERLRHSPVVWGPIPIGVGIALLGFITFNRQRKRTQAEEADERIKVKGPWSVQVLGALPLRTISRIYGALNSYTLPEWFRVPGYKLYGYIFGVNFDECEVDDLKHYRSLSEFFMRRLKPGARVAEDGVLISPADGKVVNFGYIENRRVEQVKGVTYSLDALLSGVGPEQKKQGVLSKPSVPPTDQTQPPTGKHASSTDEEEFADINGLQYSVDDLIGDEDDTTSSHDSRVGSPPVDADTRPNRSTRYEKTTPVDASVDDSERSARGDSDRTLVTDAQVALSLAKSPDMPWTVKGVPRPGNKMFFAVVYLAPGDYHRFHSPTAWVVERRRHFGGELFSVSPWMAKRLQDLFVLNERVALLGRWRYGFFSMVPVGATNVGSVTLNFDKELRTNAPQRPARPGTFAEATYAKASALLNGQPLRAMEEMGGFWLGSTIVLVFEAPEDFQFVVQHDQKVKVGQLLGDTKAHLQKKGLHKSS
ncbi:uncharacterized protein L969DRAFT_84502 [Mixia osmundae IAM 14324]|nr:uncharacterized protein L969DRAFT_84502 [Mixia osmundae IAM 14324]KEI42628.1 hypothetical protein L969DRAFT_84502 [Mixia osmundae IAM 14324]